MKAGIQIFNGALYSQVVAHATLKVKSDSGNWSGLVITEAAPQPPSNKSKYLDVCGPS